MATIAGVKEGFSSPVEQNSRSDAQNSRYTVFNSSDVPTSLSELFERTKPENEEQFRKRDYQNFTGQVIDSDLRDTDTPTRKRPKLGPDSSSPREAIPVETDIFDFLPKEFPGLSTDLLERIERIRSNIRSAKKEVMWVMQKLCSITPLSASELSVVVNREESSLMIYIRTMLKQDQLFCDAPSLLISHKDQKFVAPAKLDPLPSVLPKVASPTPTIAVEDISKFLPTGFPGLSKELEQKIQKIRSPPQGIPVPHSSSPEEIKEVIEELCSIIPFSALELAIALKRKMSTILKGYISPMLEARSLFRTNPSISAYKEEQRFVAANVHQV